MPNPPNEEEFLFGVDSEASEVADDAAADEVTPPVRYAITSFGADPDVEGLVKRIRRGEVFIPPFQRQYVWNQKEASRFIESLLLGLPVPGIFLAKEDETNKLLVLDGQQRLKTLQFFYDGFFNPREGDAKQKVFTLTDVQKPFDGCTYKTLAEKDRIQLDNAIIHATIVKQDSPEDDDTSIYHIFERLNSGGRRLTNQEIRTATYHGALIELIKTLNALPPWREVYGKQSPRLKDEELILRFLALFYWGDQYEKPMSDFLSRFAAKHRQIKPSDAKSWTDVFTSTIELIATSLEKSAFRPERSLNAAVFDSVMVGLAKRLQTSKPQESEFKAAYSKLLSNPDYQKLTSSSTADKANVETRIKMASDSFSSEQ